MNWWHILILVFIFLLVCVAIFNPKLKLGGLFIKQLQVFYRYDNKGKTKVSSFLDIFTFIILPIVISCLIVWGFDYHFLADQANIVLTVVSVLFSILFAILSLITAKSSSNNKIELLVIKETFVSTCTSTVSLLFSIVLLIIYCLIFNIVDSFVLNIFTNFILIFLMHSLLLLIMVIKRFVLIYFKHIGGEN